VALGRGWQLLNPATPTFNDVPPGSAFYTVIETAYSLGVISGYSCGTNCRAFHPTDTANRGQASKIIDIARTTSQPTSTATPAPPTNTRLPTNTPMPPSNTAVPASPTPAPTDTPNVSSTPTATPTPPVIAGFN